jgi:xanthine dehydrogenase accessory factor
MSGWVAALARLAQAGTPAALVTVVGTEGSAPREAGAKLVVWADGSDGTIGGGALELLAVEEARRLLSEHAEGHPPGGPLLRELALGPSLGQCCGGRVTLLLELVTPPAWTVAVFGAGHVGRALVRLLADLPCRVTWVDARAAEFPAAVPPGIRRIVPDDEEGVVEELERLAPGSDVLVMTHSHGLDYRLVEAGLRRADLRFLGLIGSATKRAKFASRLEARGMGPALARLTCPIGVPGARGKRPAEIAIAVAAQLLQVQAGAEASRAALPTTG